MKAILIIHKTKKIFFIYNKVLLQNIIELPLHKFYLSLKQNAPTPTQKKISKTLNPTGEKQ